MKKKLNTNEAPPYYKLFTWYSDVYYSNTETMNFRSKILKSYNIVWEENAFNGKNNFGDLLDTVKTYLIEKAIDYVIINKLFLIIYFYYYNISNFNHEGSDPDQKDVKGKSLADVLINYDKPLKQSLDLILLLCSVHSKEGYNQFVSLIKMDQVTLQKYDFHKPYVQLFESVTIPIRRSTNAKINELFDLIDYDIPGLYNIYGKDGFYDVVNDAKNDTYIGFDRINQSADKKKAPHLEIYLAMEFAGGLIVDSNKDAVWCLFENKRLGRRLEKIIKKEKVSADILEMSEYIDLSDLIKKTEKDIKIKEEKEAKDAKEAKEAKAVKDAKESVSSPATPSQSKDDLLQIEIDKLPGVSQDIRKKIMEKINKDIPSVKELADTISKYNKDLSLKSVYDKILTKAKNEIETLIKNTTYDVDENPNLTFDKKQQSKFDLLDYQKIKDLIKALTDQAVFADKAPPNPPAPPKPQVPPKPPVPQKRERVNIMGGKTRRHKKKRRNKKTRRHHQ
jgi:hypothetical protein